MSTTTLNGNPLILEDIIDKVKRRRHEWAALQGFHYDDEPEVDDYYGWVVAISGKINVIGTARIKGTGYGINPAPHLLETFSFKEATRISELNWNAADQPFPVTAVVMTTSKYIAEQIESLDNLIEELEK